MCLAAVVSMAADINISLTDKQTKEPVIMATCVLDPSGIYATTDLNGKAVMHNVPDGDYTLKVTYVGYEPINLRLKVSKDLNLTLQMIETSLSLKEVTVTAKQNASGSSTSSIIGRQAIDHLQATSLADVLQLIPGQLMGNNDLQSQTNLQLRTLVNNNTSAFGSGIVVDGMPISNNGELTQGQFSSTAFVGTDLRQIAADDIQEVEVIRGIPSAEYGDITSSMVVVHSIEGVTPWNIKGKINPSLQNYSLSKGFKLKNGSVINFGGDYAQSWSDPRQKTRSFHRYTFNVSYKWSPINKWNTTTKIKFTQSRDWSGNDPDAQADGTESKATTTNWTITHNGKIAIDKPLMRTLSYTVGANFTKSNSRTTSYVSNSTGFLPILTARETGYYTADWQNASYLATGITEGRPAHIYAKLNNSFFWRKGKTIQNFKIGGEYNLDWNSGKGYYNADDALPYKPNSNGRPRAFSDIPALHQIALYAEDAFTWNINKINRLKITAGARFTALQPFGSVATTALSPRLNMSMSITKWLDIRAGIGMNSKTPSLAYLYPDKKYDDRVAANYMPQDNTAGQIYAYHTQVYDVEKSKELKNATTTKVEAGLDFKLPKGKKLSLLAYYDRTPNGFGSATEYFTYQSNFYSATQGLVITPGAATTIDYSNPERTDIVFMTTGKIGNTNTTVNKGIEMDFDFGEWKPIKTSFYLSGAWSQTKTWSTDLNSSSISAALLPAAYSGYGLTPLKVVYPSGQDYDRYRRLVMTLRTVTHIPRLKMVLSLTAQAVFHSSTYNFIADKNPIGWIDTDLQYHDITSSMLSGYLGMDAQYYDTKPTGQSSVAIADLYTSVSDKEATKTPVTWNTSARLTKEFGKIGGLSFYVNNTLFYEPYLTGNKTSTLTQRNTGTFSFGAELYFNL